MCIGNKQRETFDIIFKHFQGQFDKANRVSERHFSRVEFASFKIYVDSSKTDSRSGLWHELPNVFKNAV